MFRFVVPSIVIAALGAIMLGAMRGGAVLSQGAATAIPTAVGSPAPPSVPIHTTVPAHGQFVVGTNPPCQFPNPCLPPAPVIVNDADVAADLRITGPRGFFLATYPRGYQPQNDRCIANENAITCALPVGGGQVRISATPETTTQELPAGTWQLVSNPFDVPAQLEGADAVWVWDGVSYVQVDQLQPHQAAWAFASAGGPLSFTALPR